MTRNLCKEVGTDNVRYQYNRFKNVILYDDIAEVQEYILQGKALSFLVDTQFNNDTVYVTVKNADTLGLHKVQFDDRQGEKQAHLFYSLPCVCTEAHLSFQNIRNIDFNVLCPCVGFSRKFEERKGQTYLYVCMSSDWLYRKKGGAFTLPSFDRSVEEYFNTYK